MNSIVYRVGKKIMRVLGVKEYDWYSEDNVQYFDQRANDLVYDSIVNAKDGLMICKFGTVELNAVVCFLLNQKGIRYREMLDAILGKCDIYPEVVLEPLCNNAGFFPFSVELWKQYAKLVLEDVKQIDVLGSYDKHEKYLEQELFHCKKVNLNGYYAPFLWKEPWTRALAGKKVLVVHPFVESIKEQYQKRELLFENRDVLPEFKELLLVQAVQSIASNGNATGFANWFEALEYMKNEIDKKDYDIALIGCGAYGMNLAAHVKRKGKIAIHLAGWTQMLFGIYGSRWLNDQPEFKKYINEHWIRPSISERPKGVETVENACYW